MYRTTENTIKTAWKQERKPVLLSRKRRHHAPPHPDRRRRQLLLLGPRAWPQYESSEPEWQGDELVGEGSWYYFGSNGKAIKSDGSKAKVYEVGDKKYVFDHYGRMMSGWVTESGEYVESEDDWANGLYYADGEGDGSVVTNAWVYTTVPDDTNEDETEPTYHFYFGSNGKKTVSTKKSIGGKEYFFDERGVAQYGWHKGDDGDWDWSYYGDSEEPYLRTGWFQAVPDSEMHSSAHDDGSVYWYYSTSAGKTAVSEFRTIDGKTYAFNEYGELVTGLKKVKVDSSDKKKIQNNQFCLTISVI
mgnify:CR=1 FL=1